MILDQPIPISYNFCFRNILMQQAIRKSLLGNHTSTSLFFCSLNSYKPKIRQSRKFEEYKSHCNDGSSRVAAVVIVILPVLLVSITSTFSRPFQTTPINSSRISDFGPYQVRGGRGAMWLQQRVLGGIQKASESVQHVLGEIDHQLDESLKHGKPVFLPVHLEIKFLVVIPGSSTYRYYFYYCSI